MSVLHSEPDVSSDYHKVPSWSITEFTEDFQVFGLGVFCPQHQRCVMNEYLRYRPGRDLPRWDDDGSTRSRTLDDRMMSPVIAGLLFTPSLPSQTVAPANNPTI